MNEVAMKAIMYHYVRPFDDGFPNFKNLDVADFHKQLDYFEDTFGFVSKEDFLTSLRTGVPTPGVILTFDDGFKDHIAHVLPALEERGLWGIFYITTGVYQKETLLDVHKIHLLLGKISSKEVFEAVQSQISPKMLSHNTVDAFREATYKLQDNDDHTNLVKRTLNYYIDYVYRSQVIDALMEQFFEETPSQLFRQFYLSEEELKRLHSAGMLVGSHTVSHPVMSKLNLMEQHQEIENSFSFLEQTTGRILTKTFCYPYGGFHTFTEDTRRLLNEAHVAFSFNVEPRDISEEDLSQHLQALPRYDCNQFPHGSCRN